jgi:Na+-transporting NADH:ubiquinone oxidoreductase subunit C
MLSKQQQKSFIFALVMCVVCGVFLTGTAVGLKERQEKNVKIDKQKNILKSLGFIEAGRKYSADEIEGIYQNEVTSLWVDPSGQLKQAETDGALPIYVVGSLDSIRKYAVPFAAYGLWSWVRGFVAFEGDGTTVKGLTVYSHAETPGLGGEVEKPWFQDQYVGKKIAKDDGTFVSVGVVKGKVEDKVPAAEQDYYVDGISGATITAVGMDKYMRETLAKYEPFAQKLRKGR